MIHNQSQTNKKMVCQLESHITSVPIPYLSFFSSKDIAVDGWALTMLSRKNVGMASTCNTIGQMVGYLAAFVVFLALNSAAFCNRSEVPAGWRWRDGAALKDATVLIITAPPFLHGSLRPKLILVLESAARQPNARIGLGCRIFPPETVRWVAETSAGISSH